MDLGFDNQALLDTVNHVVTEPGAVRHPDWTSLKARFLASHALNRALFSAAGQAAAGGSFPAAGALVLAQNRLPLSDVNLVALGNGKAPSAIAEIVASAPQAATED